MEQDYHSEKIYIAGKNGRGTYTANPDYIPGCERTLLIQRMKHPRDSSGHGSAFGGGLERGGLSETAWDLLKDICSFDYMGASEFEMGALPKAFMKISQVRDLEAFTVDVMGSPEFPQFGKMAKTFDRSELSNIKKTHVLTNTVFVIAPKMIRPYVQQTIHRIARGDENFLKEHTNLRKTLFCAWHWTDDEEDFWRRQATQGWVELDNGYIFFASEDMWRNFCSLFLDVQPSFDIKPAQPDFASVDKALEGCKKHA